MDDIRTCRVRGCRKKVPAGKLGEQKLSFPLSNGVALIDLDDIAVVAPYRWSAIQAKSGQRYAVAWDRGPDGQRLFLYMHRLIVTCPDGLTVDHVNDDGLDNRRANLRLATKSQNTANQRSINPGFRGVYRVGNRWAAKIWVNRRGIYLGCFLTPDEAAQAYDDAAREHFGEFARPNSGGPDGAL